MTGMTVELLSTWPRNFRDYKSRITECVADANPIINVVALCYDIYEIPRDCYVKEVSGVTLTVEKQIQEMNRKQRGKEPEVSLNES
jgi:hypothetical protein